MLVKPWQLIRRYFLKYAAMKYLIFTGLFFLAFISFGQNHHAHTTKSTASPEEGLLNYINSNAIQPNISGIQINQTGDLNSAAIRGKNMKLNQNGYNQQFYFNETSIVPSNLKVNLEGVNNYVEITGSNQLINNATINIQGNSRSVIIRNYR